MLFPVNMFFYKSSCFFFKNTLLKNLAEIMKSHEVQRKLQIKSFYNSVERVDSNSSVSPELAMTLIASTISIGLRGKDLCKQLLGNRSWQLIY